MRASCVRIVTAFLILTTVVVQAEELLVVTQGMNAQHLPSGAYVTLVDTENPQPSSGMLVSETRWTRDWMFSIDRARLAGTELPRTSGVPDQRAPVQIRLNPLRVETPASQLPDRLIAAVPVATDGSGETATALVYQVDQRGTLAYRAAGRMLTLPLSAQPVGAVPGPGGESVIIVQRDPASGEFGIQWCDTTGARTIHRVRPVESTGDQYEVRLDHLVLSPDGTRLILGFSGYVLHEADGGRRAWLDVWDLTAREVVRTHRLAEGTWPSGAAPIVCNDQGEIWALTHTPGRGFVYLSQFGDGAEARQLSFSGVHETPVLARGTGGASEDHVALALDRRVQMYDRELKRYQSIDLPHPAGALVWTPQNLLAGLGNRLWLLSYEATPKAITAFDTGHVVGIIPVTGAKSAEYDAVPKRRLPRQIQFSENRIGLESHALALTDPADILEKPPWIKVTPGTGSHVSLSVDSASLPRGTTGFGEILIRAQGADEMPYRIITRLVSRSAPEPRLLWIRNPAAIPQSVLWGSSAFSTLVRTLSSYPAMIRHDELAAPANIDLAAYSGIVLTSANAAHGILTRQEILDYLAGGGTVYLLATLQPGQTDLQSTRWLDAVGIQISAAAPLSGVFTAPRRTGLLRHWADTAIERGAALNATDLRTRLVPAGDDPDSAILAVGAYGRGRVIAVASSTPLENRALEDPRGLRFAQALFDLRGQPDAELNDADQDGIPDHVEDRNGNGTVDAGETDALNADTDLDGIPDGLEDINQNGFVDELETHPLLADTDADGVPDPADIQPLPPTGTPYIAAVEPSTMPAEGSGTITITGRNFSPDSQIWFGQTQTPGFRVLSSSQVEAIVPPLSQADPEPVTLRVVNDDGGQAAELENGFRYTAASPATLTLRPLRAAREVYGVYALHTQAVISPTDVALGLVKVMLEVQPAEAAETLTVHAGQNLTTPLIARPAGPGRILVVVNDVPRSAHPIALFRIQMRANTILAGTPEMTIQLGEKVVRSEYGGVLDSSAPTDIYYNFASTFHPFIE